MNEGKKDSYNYGLDILRIWMCFEVIIDHFMKWDGVSNKYDLAQPIRLIYEYDNVAAPVFMVMSFMLCDISVIALDNDKIKKRLYRLFIPYLFWNCFYFIAYAIISFLRPGSVTLFGIKDFISQFLFGSIYNATLWFQVEILLITILFIIIYKYLKKYYANLLLFALAIVSIVIQYTGFLAKLYMIDHYSTLLGRIFDPADYVLTVFRFFEVLPMAVIGTLIFQYGLIKDRSLKHRIIIIAGMMLLLDFFRNTPFFVQPSGFGYGGVQLIMVALLTVYLFLYLPIELLPSLFKKCIKALAGTTMATYYMHRLIETIIRIFFIEKYPFVKMYSLEYCLLIFMLSIAVSLLLKHIPIKWVKDSF